MSSRRSMRASSILTEEEINDLLLKLQALLPESSASSSSITRIAASKILKETCSYLKKLQREVDDLSERLSQLLASMDTTGDLDANILIRTLLQQ